MPLARDARLLAGGFAASALVHLLRPSVWEPGMPAWVPAHREVIYASGVAELACAAGMLHPRTRTVASYAAAALLVGVFPANVQMAQDAVRGHNTTLKLLSLARLPLQLPMIRIALRAARSS